MERPSKNQPKACSKLQRKEYQNTISGKTKLSNFGGIQKYKGDIISKEINFFRADFKLDDKEEEVLPESAVIETSHILSLDLPTVVKLQDVKIDQNQVRLFMPDLGFSVEKFLNEREYTEADARPIIFSALGTLAEIHSRGVIHGDIKADNFLLKNRNGVPILIDFGLSAQSVVLRDGTIRPIVRISGDPEFQAPELQREEETSFTAKIDTWALALMWIRMVIPLNQEVRLSDEEIKAMEQAANYHRPGDQEFKEQMVEEEVQRRRTMLRSKINGYLMTTDDYRIGLNILQKYVSIPLFKILSSMLKFNPADRPSAIELLSNGYFSNLPKSKLSLLSPAESISARTYRIHLNLNEKQLTWRSDHLIWFFEKCRYYSLSYRIYFLAVKILDIVWSLDKKLILEDTPDVCLSLAQKFLYGHSSTENIHAHDLGELLEELGNDNERYLEALDLEIKIYQLLCFNVNYSTAYDYFLLNQGTAEQRNTLLILLRTGLPLMISDQELAKTAMNPIPPGSDLEALIESETIEDFDSELLDE